MMTLKNASTWNMATSISHGISEVLENIWRNKQRKNQVKKGDDTCPSRVDLVGSPSWLSRFIKPQSA